jgi:threonine dehydrogenase-like Zn-dependent dehydrogenase
MNLSGNDTIAIFGQGPVGLAATQYAKAMGARVIALDISPQRLERSKAFGADEVVDPGSNIEKVVDQPETVNDDPYGDGWLVRIRMSDPSQVEALMDADAYRAHVAEQ